MRASGLGHVLSISGLHMALVAGSAFWLIRALLALSPALALTPADQEMGGGRRRSRVATFYLGISGGERRDRPLLRHARDHARRGDDRPARADAPQRRARGARRPRRSRRRACSSASFQMSFAATLALVAAYEAIVGARRPERRRLPTRADRGSVARLGRRSATGLFLTSLIAGLATTPFARLPLPAGGAADASSPTSPRCRRSASSSCRWRCSRSC